MLRSVFEAPVNLYFDQTPIGRILNRFSKDLNVLDSDLPFQVGTFLATNYLLFYVIVVAIIAVPYTAILLPIIIAWSSCLIRQVSASITQTTRLRSTTKSPSLSFLQETISGSSTIRAFKRQ